MRSFGSSSRPAGGQYGIGCAPRLGATFLRLTRTRPPSRPGFKKPRSLFVERTQSCCRFGQRWSCMATLQRACIRGQLRRAPVVDAAPPRRGRVPASASPDGRVSREYGVVTGTVVPREVRTLTVSRPSLRMPGQVAHEGARRVANRGESHRPLQHGGEEGAEELVRDDPQLLFALEPLPLPTWALECASNSSARRRAVRRWTGIVAKIDLDRGVDGLVHFNAPSWAVRAVMSRTTLPVCPKTGSTSRSLRPSLPTHCSGKSGMRPAGTVRADLVEPNGEPGNRRDAPSHGGRRTRWVRQSTRQHVRAVREVLHDCRVSGFWASCCTISYAAVTRFKKLVFVTRC